MVIVKEIVKEKLCLLGISDCKCKWYVGKYFTTFIERRKKGRREAIGRGM